MTTTDQDRLLEEIFCRPDVASLDCRPRPDGSVVVLDDNGRLWRVTPNGDLVTPNGLPILPEGEDALSLLDGDWDLQRPWDEEKIRVVRIAEEDGETAVYFQTWRPDGAYLGEEAERMELVEFLGELGRTFREDRTVVPA